MVDAEQLDAIDGQVVAVEGHRSRAERVRRDDVDAVRITIDERQYRHAAGSAPGCDAHALWPLVGDALEQLARGDVRVALAGEHDAGAEAGLDVSQRRRECGEDGVLLDHEHEGERSVVQLEPVDRAVGRNEQTGRASSAVECGAVVQTQSQRAGEEALSRRDPITSAL